MNEKWDRRFLELAKGISTWSKDENTKVGCVLVKDQAILSTGYNGQCRGVSDDIPARLQRPEKYFHFEHAERNAVYNAAKTGIGLQGSVAYATLCPCMDCGRALVQSGITRVVTYQPKPMIYSIQVNGPFSATVDTRWEEHFKRTIQLFKETGVELVLYE